MKLFREKNFTSFFFLIFSFSIAGGLIFLFVAERETLVIIHKKDIASSTPIIQTIQKIILQKQTQQRPNNLKAIYITMYTAQSKAGMKHIFDILDNTQINALVIDVKDSGGKLIFNSFDIATLLEKLHKNNVYLIARMVAFQNSNGIQTTPNAMIRQTNNELWKDNAGFTWLDPASEDGWKYIFKTSKQAIDVGFDEINYDYVRFPSEGSLDSTIYPSWNKTISKSEVIGNFAKAANLNLKKYNKDIIISADIFGYTFLRKDDLNIGQRLVHIINGFDFIYPMVYPSHYSAGNFGFENPAVYPYEVVKLTLDYGIEQLKNASSSVVWDGSQINPWLQSFNLGAMYTKDRMHAQIEATKDSLGNKNTGWLLWDPKNRYDGIFDYLALDLSKN